MSIIIRFLCCICLISTVAWAGSPIPIPALEKKADAIVLATLQDATAGTEGGIAAKLLIVAVLKGQIPTSTVVVQYTSSPDNDLISPDNDLMKDLPTMNIPGGPTGVWFLKMAADGNYDIVPIGGYGYTWFDAFLPVSTGWSPPASGTLNQILLDALLGWYTSLPDPNFLDANRLWGSLQQSDRTDALAIVDQLLKSPIVENRVMGIVAAIHLGSDAALTLLADDIETLRSGKNFNEVILAIYPEYQPNGLSSLGPLSRLVALQSDVPGLDHAVVRALSRVGNVPHTPEGGPGPAVPAAPGTAPREVLPIFVELLDSRDPQAQLKAAWLLGQFALRSEPIEYLAGSKATSRQLRTDEIVAYMPWDGSNISVAVYVSYWKTWWASNRAKHGFPGP